MTPRPRVVVVGSGFGGLNCALRLARQPVEVTVVDRDNYHGFWPLLYQVATGGLGVDDIARPARSLYARHLNVSSRMGTVTGFDLEKKLVVVEGQPELAYDYLVVAAGSSTTDFGIPGVGQYTFALKTLPDAARLRNHLLTTWEAADADPNPGTQAAMTVVLIGGGPTGVELAGAISELMSVNLARDYRNLDASQARVVLVEMSDHLLVGFAPRLQREALNTLRAKGVEVALGAKLAAATATGARLEDGSTIEASTLIWTAGVAANPLAGAFPTPKGKGRTVLVEPDLSLPGHPEVFVVGDLAAARGKRGEQLPQLAQVAIQGGRHAAEQVARLVAGRPTRPFSYHDHGIMATIGRRDAVAQLPGGLTMTGTLGWLAWLAVHLFFLVGFRNRAVVFVSWAYSYVTWDRSARVIFGPAKRAG
ncbi:MAG: NAD(P)/FAD-dependent oxidoreductase [Acidimicrobiales bacterium]